MNEGIPTTIMVCSSCGNTIAYAYDGSKFDVYDTSWICHACGVIWLSSDGWKSIGLLLIPY